MSGLIRVVDNSGCDGTWPRPSFLILAIVGMMGWDLPEVGVLGNNPALLRALFRVTVFSALTRILLFPDPAEEGVAGGRVAAVHVSVTGHNSDFTLVTPMLVLM